MKKLLAIALAGAMVLSFTACGSKEDKTTAAAPAETAGTTAGAEAGTTAAGAERQRWASHSSMLIMRCSRQCPSTRSQTCAKRAEPA